ncbi:MAG: hypothetical protein LR017_02370 [Candidatus Pacebacteria bacterium]|nr:hypothetical protein [Candidatus Paceibacterota bacterium]
MLIWCVGVFTASTLSESSAPMLHILWWSWLLLGGSFIMVAVQHLFRIVSMRSTTYTWISYGCMGISGLGVCGCLILYLHAQ